MIMVPRTFFNVNVACHLIISLVIGPVAFLAPPAFVAAQKPPVAPDFFGVRMVGAAIVTSGVVGSAVHLMLGPSTGRLILSIAGTALVAVAGMLDYPSSHRPTDFVLVFMSSYFTLFYLWFLLAKREGIPLNK